MFGIDSDAFLEQGDRLVVLPGVEEALGEDQGLTVAEDDQLKEPEMTTGFSP